MSIISGMVSNVLPAPDIAWYVVTAAFFMPNFLSGCRRGTYDCSEQLLFTAINPRFVPRRFLCASMTEMWSEFISGMTMGTSGVNRCALLFETIGHSSFAYAYSSSFISSFFMFTAQKQKSTDEAIFSLSAAASNTTMSAYFSGMGALMCQRRSASLYFFPAEEEEAASAVTLNQG